MSFASDFKEFALKGNVMDLAVGVIIGAAFGKIVDSLVADVIMPIVSRIFGGLDFSNYFIQLAPAPAGYNGPMTYEALSKAGVPLFAYGYFLPLAGQTANTLVEAKKAGAVLAYGNFITIALNFVILAFIVFMMVKQVNRLRKATPPAAAVTAEEVVLLREIRDSLNRR